MHFKDKHAGHTQGRTTDVLLLHRCGVKDLIWPNQTQHAVPCVDGMLLCRTAVSASGMVAFLPSGFSSRSSRTGARAFALTGVRTCTSV